MWPNQPLDFVKLDNDAEGRHFGLVLDSQLVSVISLFTTHNEAQFRKFATLPEYQGQGLGTLLLTEVFRIAKQEQLSRIWCNARLAKMDFYLKFGMSRTQTTFSKAGIDYVILERNFN